MVYLSLTGNFATRCDIRGGGGFNLTADKISIGKPKTKIKNHDSKYDFMWFVLYEKLVAFFWNFGLHVDRTLSVKFTLQQFPNHGLCH